MKYKNPLIKSTYLVPALFFCTSLSAQNIPNYKNNYIYAGLNVRIASIGSGTSIKNLFGVKLGYNQKLNDHAYGGPVIEAMFIRSPVNRGARISLFAGPSIDYDIGKYNYVKHVLNSTFVSTNASWVFPINPATTDYTYLDCISVSASFNSKEFYGLNKTSIDINLNFQRYDIGFSTGNGRMLNISTGTRTNF